MTPSAPIGCAAAAGCRTSASLLTDRPGEHARQPAGVAMLAGQARELAFELLELAEQAEHQRKPVGS